MPTPFCACEDCVFLDVVPIDHPINRIYYNDFQVHKLLIQSLKLPTDLAYRVVRMSKRYYKCSYCPKMLCTAHRDRGLQNGEYGTIKCSDCCWMDI